MQRKKQLTLFLALIFLLSLSLNCNFVSSLLGNSKQFEDGLVQDYHPSASPVSQYTLSVTQQAYVDEYGYPDRFSIFFFDEMLPDREMFSMRHESWYYDARGYEIVFRNGDKFTERSGAPIQIEGLGRTVYSPQGFTAETNLDSLLALRGETGFFVQNVDDDLITGELIFIQDLAAGFEEGRLSYVETLPLSEASQSAETPPLADAPPPEEDSGGLTPQESANQGTHTYEMSCTYADGSEDNWSTSLAFEFIEGGVNLIYESIDTSFYYQEVGVNTYEYIYEGEKEALTFTDLGIRKESSSGSSCNSLRLEDDGGLTPQESANQGTHTYETSCTWSSGSVSNWSGVLAFEFLEGGVNMMFEDGETSFLQEIAINTYEDFEYGDVQTTTFTDVGVQQINSSFNCTSLRK